MSRNNIFGYSSLKSLSVDLPLFRSFDDTGKKRLRRSVGGLGLVTRWNIACSNDLLSFLNVFLLEDDFVPQNGIRLWPPP